MAHLKEARLTWANNKYILMQVKRAWEKLNKYYRITNRLITYIGATVLNPYHKWQWFNRSWITPNLLPALLRDKANLRQL